MVAIASVVHQSSRGILPHKSMFSFVVQASASQGDGVALVEALIRQRLLTSLQCLHCVAVATRIPVVALPTDLVIIGIKTLICQLNDAASFTSPRCVNSVVCIVVCIEERVAAM